MAPKNDGTEDEGTRVPPRRRGSSIMGLTSKMPSSKDLLDKAGKVVTGAGKVAKQAKDISKEAAAKATQAAKEQYDKAQQFVGSKHARAGSQPSTVESTPAASTPRYQSDPNEFSTKELDLQSVVNIINGIIGTYNDNPTLFSGYSEADFDKQKFKYTVSQNFLGELTSNEIDILKKVSEKLDVSDESVQKLIVVNFVNHRVNRATQSVAATSSQSEADTMINALRSSGRLSSKLAHNRDSFDDGALPTPPATPRDSFDDGALPTPPATPSFDDENPPPLPTPPDSPRVDTPPPSPPHKKGLPPRPKNKQ